MKLLLEAQILGLSHFLTGSDHLHGGPGYPEQQSSPQLSSGHWYWWYHHSGHPLGAPIESVITLGAFTNKEVLERFAKR